MLVYHHGGEHSPNTYHVEYWDGSAWQLAGDISTVRWGLQTPPAGVTGWGAIPTDSIFPAVTASKVRFVLNNCNITHGWIYEFEVFNSQQTAVLSITPATSTINVGQTFSVTVQVQTWAQAVDGAAAYLNFDPTALRVEQLTPGTALPVVIQSTYDNSAGQISFAAGNLTPPNPSGPFNPVPITFTALAQTSGTPLTFSSTLPRKSEVTANGDSVLDYTANGTVVANPSATLNACVTLLDFSLLVSNFGRAGQLPQPRTGRAPVREASGTVQLRIDPPTQSVVPGQVVTVTVQVQAGTQLVDGAQASLDFDPALLRVRQLTAGSALPQVLLNQSSNTAGTLDFAAGTLTNFPSGTFTLVQIQLETVAPAANAALAFHSGIPRNSDVTFGGASVLDGTSSEIIGVQPPTATPTVTATPTNTPTPTPQPCTVVPARPTLLAPRNSATANTRQVALDWTDAKCASRYEVQVRQGRTSGTIVDKATNLVLSQYNTRSLTPTQNYYWRVRACDNKGCSAWTNYWKFTVSKSAMLSEQEGLIPAQLADWLMGFLALSVAGMGLGHLEAL